MSLFSGLGGLSGQFWSTLIGAVVGAVVSGGVTWMVQAQSARIDRKVKERAVREKRLTTATTLSIKCIRMLSSLSIAGSVIDEALTKCRLSTQAVKESWQFVQPFATRLIVVELTDEERIFAISTRNDGLIKAALELEDIYKNFADLVDLYSAKREEFSSQIESRQVSEDTVRTGFTPDEYDRLSPQRMVLNNLISNLSTRGRQDTRQAVEVFDLLKKHCIKEFGRDYLRFEKDEERLKWLSTDGG